MKKIYLSILASVMLPSIAHAASATANFNVTITITKECAVTTPATIDFGSHGATQSLNGTVATTTFSVTCSKTTPYDIGFSSTNDVVATPTTHQMKGAAVGNSDVVQYNLLDITSGATNTAPLDGSASRIHDTGNGSAQSKTLQAKIINYSAAVQNDTYTDTVTMTVAY